MKRKNMTWKELEVEKKFQAEKKAEIKEAVKMLLKKFRLCLHFAYLAILKATGTMNHH